jgi:sporulation protein YlmC with PRC-barrel domain
VNIELSENKFLPVQRFAGLQVIDAKGVLVGNVKDIAVDFHNRSLAFVVAAKNGRELDISWEDVLSMEDVILLKKEITLPPQEAKPTTQPPPPVQAMMICPDCGGSAPGQAKFCPKCGHSLK